MCSAGSYPTTALHAILRALWEVAIGERPFKKTCHKSSSFQDLLAFSGTCRSCLVILPRETYLFTVQLREILQIACATWAAHMGILSSPIMRTASLSMCTMEVRIIHTLLACWNKLLVRTPFWCSACRKYRFCGEKKWF
ncbi:hypothetical protein GUJ93_ZPchr0006g43983 [Zizania palustris]|uniref:Uncharacterized protein n=1 Tax=Zizania palustris TaxID=103762 RepID=A0A8J5VIZ4_ZIZPA|nr:hypothetical protein GUJ93_ZPchr0006g43983 [Zizania palustris]